MWGQGRGQRGEVTEALHTTLARRLASLEALLPRLHVRNAEVSQRDMVQARSRTALSCRLDARLLAGGAANGGVTGGGGGGGAAAGGSSTGRPADIFFGQPELLEHTLSFISSPEILARVGAVCSLCLLYTSPSPRDS